MCFVFFFKQKTAYEMRISDWSSDVCSSDLRPHAGWIISLLDVTKEHSELELIRQRAEHLHHTVEMNPQLPWCGEADGRLVEVTDRRSEEHTSELQSLMRISYAVFCLKKKNT